MKVLHVISDENIGGAGILLTTLLQSFDPNRVQSVVAMPKGSLLYDRIRCLDVPIYSLEYPCNRFSLPSIKEVKRIIKAENASVIHANAAFCARLAGKLTHRYVIHTRHCCFEPSRFWNHKVVRFVGGRLNERFSDRIIATADAAAENLCRLGVRKDHIDVIINGSNPIRTVTDSELYLARRKYRIDQEDFCIGICARLEPYKGHEIFLQAVKIVMKRIPDRRFCFLVVGTGSMEEKLKSMAVREGIAPYVRFTGFVEDMAIVYRLLRLNINCSSGTETSCSALSEGMSASLPFIASNYGGNASMLGESDAGMLFEVGNAEALADQICRFVSNSDLEDRMKKAALARYKEKYTAVGMANALTAVYEKLLQI